MQPRLKIEPTSRAYLERQAAVESNARTYPRRLPLVIERAEGIRVWDVDGKMYLDCLACAGALALGHNHPVVVDAIQRHLASGAPMQALDLATPTKDAFVSALLASLPGPFASRARLQFCGPTGSDAVEAAIKLVKTATGRRGIFAFQGAYHGHTNGALALMGNLTPKARASGLMPEVHFLPYPYSYRCPYGCNACSGNCAGFKNLETTLDDVESGILLPAGIIVEIVQGEGGCIPAPNEWLRDLRRITREHQIPLIVDEVQTAWGRTGTLYAFERAGIEPDVLVLSKAIGGGLPLAVVAYDEHLDVWQPGAHAGTFRGNQLAMATGLATLRYIQQKNLPAHAEAMGERLRKRLRALQTKRPFLGDVRGRGLMIGVEVVEPDRRDRWGRPPADGERARRIQRACLDLGLIIEVGGRHGSVLRFLPPLNVTPGEIDAIADILAEACAASSAAETNGV
jgi:diaminobutyrate-2-oxoglutarate transaminase